MNLFETHLIQQQIENKSLRFMQMGNQFYRYVYSSDGSYLMPPNITDINVLSIEYIKERFEDFNNSVLIEIQGTPEFANQKLKEFSFLFNHFKEEYKFILGFNESQVYNFHNQIHFRKTYNVNIIIEESTNTLFFSCISPFILEDYKSIMKYIEDLHNQYDENCYGFKTKSIEFDTSKLTPLKIIHLFTLESEETLKPIYQEFSKFNWVVKRRGLEYVENKYQNLMKHNSNIILCEGNNIKLLKNLQLDKILFSDELNAFSLYQCVKSKSLRAIRDKDYLTFEEVSKLKKKFPSYIILHYYSIEGYLYHPDNIEECIGSNFDKQQYINYIVEMKNKSILNGKITEEKIRNIRKTYNELNDNHINQTKDAEKEIFKSLKSNEFRVFYPHFDIKNMSKGFLNKYRTNDFKLSTTHWFRKRMNEVLINK